MAEFRRLISYIYEYEGHVKGKNVGFVKLEARNGMCKLNVNVKKLYMGSGDMGVYLMTGRQEIFLGNIFLRNGSGEFRTMVQVADVQESGETMDECYGLTIHGKGENWRIYTTIWEDAVAQAAQVTLESVTSEQALENEVEKGKLSPVILDQEGRKETQSQQPQEEYVQPEDRILPEESQQLQPEGQMPPVKNQQTRPEGQMPPEENQQAPPEGQMPQEKNQQPQPQGQISSGEEPRPLTEGKVQEGQGEGTGRQTEQNINRLADQLQVTGATGVHSIPNFEMGQLEMETEHPDIPLKQQVQAPVIRQHKEAALIVGDPEALAKFDAEDASDHQMPVWEFFLKTYPKIQAFDSEHGCTILVIKPQDIGLLPREVWIYGNNSFLLHGYYNYRYLILARLENPHGNARYLLGIPGHYYNNEKYMASMFGFPHFVLSKKQTADDGRFGYWYTDIRMGDGAMLQSDAVKNLKNQAV